ncbi:MAG: amidase [Pseudomonadales bacterium]|nr:amidase [Pseudomonadales bacterium]MDP6470122.1 amidase [Pseudomonadales bacterium]MDP6827027.1 amidase [Pseudomonadales bacterium]MDP6972083.1 amidase [Pseudomonadales bacterium]
MIDPEWWGVAELSAAIRSKRLTCAELMSWTLDRIEAHNPTINAIVNPLSRANAMHLAEQADLTVATGARLGPLHGLPTAVKDLADAAGFPTTMGFVPFADNHPAQDAEMVRRMRAAGALIIGKTNTPEFGLGSHTFNSLFGRTANPYASERSAGGSSGGAAASLAAGFFAMADGSDMGGSLRNPASFCNVVGFRPSIGRVPAETVFGWLGRLSTLGPMARTVADAARLLAVQTGCYEKQRAYKKDPLDAPLTGDPDQWLAGPAPVDLRVAYAEDLGGLPIHADVRTVLRQAADACADLGWHVEAACPDLTDAMNIFQTQRTAATSLLGRDLEARVPQWRNYAKDTAIWNIDKGMHLSTEELIRSEVARTQLYRRVTTFFEQYDVLLCPAAQLPPFPGELDWVHEIEGVTFDTYIDWMTVCCAVSATACPAVSVPAGFTDDGLPVGAQLVCAPRADIALLRIAHAFEEATEHHRQHPDLT